MVSLTDANDLVYPGARIVATASAGGSVTPAAADTDSEGLAAFRWTPGPVQPPINCNWRVEAAASRQSHRERRQRAFLWLPR